MTQIPTPIVVPQQQQSSAKIQPKKPSPPQSQNGYWIKSTRLAFANLCSCAIECDDTVELERILTASQMPIDAPCVAVFHMKERNAPPKWMSLLYASVLQRSEPCVRFLLERKADLDPSATHTAVLGSSASSSSTIAAVATTETATGNPLLFASIARDDVNVMNTLLEFKADPRAKSVDTNQTLMECARNKSAHLCLKRLQELFPDQQTATITTSVSSSSSMTDEPTSTTKQLLSNPKKNKKKQNVTTTTTGWNFPIPCRYHELRDDRQGPLTALNAFFNYMNQPMTQSSKLRMVAECFQLFKNAQTEDRRQRLRSQSESSSIFLGLGTRRVQQCTYNPNYGFLYDYCLRYLQQQLSELQRRTRMDYDHCGTVLDIMQFISECLTATKLDSSSSSSSSQSTEDDKKSSRPQSTPPLRSFMLTQPWLIRLTGCVLVQATIMRGRDWFFFMNVICLCMNILFHSLRLARVPFTEFWLFLTDSEAQNDLCLKIQPLLTAEDAIERQKPLSPTAAMAIAADSSKASAYKRIEMQNTFLEECRVFLQYEQQRKAEKHHSSLKHSNDLDPSMSEGGGGGGGLAWIVMMVCQSLVRESWKTNRESSLNFINSNNNNNDNERPPAPVSDLEVAALMILSKLSELPLPETKKPSAATSSPSTKMKSKEKVLAMKRLERQQHENDKKADDIRKSCFAEFMYYNQRQWIHDASEQMMWFANHLHEHYPATRLHSTRSGNGTKRQKHTIRSNDEDRSIRRKYRSVLLCLAKIAESMETLGRPNFQEKRSVDLQRPCLRWIQSNIALMVAEAQLLPQTWISASDFISDGLYSFCRAMYRSTSSDLKTLFQQDWLSPLFVTHPDDYHQLDAVCLVSWPQEPDKQPTAISSRMDAGDGKSSSDLSPPPPPSSSSSSSPPVQSEATVVEASIKPNQHPSYPLLTWLLVLCQHGYSGHVRLVIFKLLSWMTQHIPIPDKTKSILCGINRWTSALTELHEHELLLTAHNNNDGQDAFRALPNVYINSDDNNQRSRKLHPTYSFILNIAIGRPVIQDVRAICKRFGWACFFKTLWKIASAEDQISLVKTSNDAGDANDDDKEDPLYVCSGPGCLIEENALAKFLRCSRCKITRYCGFECQKAHWKHHKFDCKET
jgi:hypothetical protein